MWQNIIDKIRLNKALIFKAVAFIVCIVLCFLLLPKKQLFKYDFNRGDLWQYEDLSAPFDFPLLKSKQQLEEEKANILQTKRLYFSFDAMAQKQSMENLAIVSGQESLEQIYPFLVEEISYALDKGIVSDNAQDLLHRQDELVYMVKNGEESLLPFTAFITLSSFYDDVYNKVLLSFDDAEATTAKAFVESSIKPNLVYDMELSELSIAEELDNISPTYGLVQKGKHIISKGEPISDSQFLTLMSLKSAYDNSLHENKLSSFGYFIIVTLLFFLLFFYISKYKRGLYFRWKEILFLLFNIVLSFGACRLAVNYSADYIFFVPLCIQVIAVRSFLDSKVALVAQTITIFLCSLLAANFSMFVFVGFSAALIGSFVSGISQRSMIFLTVIKITAVSLVAALAFIFIQNGAMSDYTVLSYICLGGVLTLFALPLIYIYERMFGLVSDVSLLELTNNNTPLLRRLAEEAPGTFQHSMSVMNLAQASARELGADPLLIGVGAMYHDVGKLYAPQYFIENQMAGYNPLEDFSPNESAKKIMAHVSEGMELAQKYRLPKSVLRFIRTHHGRSLVHYFYQKATQEGAMENEDDFRYPFQKPYTKEEAILMVCDSVEAAARSLKIYSEETISGLVDSIVERQREDGQFNEADISYREIIKLRDFLKSRLLTVYHQRIAYNLKSTGSQKES